MFMISGNIFDTAFGSIEIYRNLTIQAKGILLKISKAESKLIIIQENKIPKF